MRNTHAHRPAPELRPPRLARREPQGPRRGRGPGRRRGRRAPGDVRDVPDRVRDRRRHRPSGRTGRRRRGGRGRGDGGPARHRRRLRLPRAGRGDRVQRAPADLPRRHPPGRLPQDAPLRLLRAGALHARRAARGPGRAGRPDRRPDDLLRRRVPGERPRPRPRRHGPARGADGADAPVPVRRRAHGAGARLREPDVRGVRQPGRPRGRVRVRRALHARRPRRSGPRPGRPGEELVLGDADPVFLAASREANPYLRDRRPGLYGSLV